MSSPKTKAQLSEKCVEKPTTRRFMDGHTSKGLDTDYEDWEGFDVKEGKWKEFRSPVETAGARNPKKATGKAKVKVQKRQKEREGKQPTNGLQNISSSNSFIALDEAAVEEVDGMSMHCEFRLPNVF